MRAERTEFAHIDDLLKSLALARSAVEFRLSHNGKPVRIWKAARDEQAALQRVAEVLGEEFPGAEPARRPRRGRPAPVRLGRLADRIARAGRLAVFLRQRPAGARSHRCPCGAPGLCRRAVPWPPCRRSCCFWNSIRPASTSTCIRPSTRCVSASSGWSTISCSAPCTRRWRRRAPGMRRRCRARRPCRRVLRRHASCRIGHGGRRGRASSARAASAWACAMRRWPTTPPCWASRAPSADRACRADAGRRRRARCRRWASPSPS